MALKGASFLDVNEAKFGVNRLDMFTRFPVDDLYFPNVVDIANAVLSIARDLEMLFSDRTRITVGVEIAFGRHVLKTNPVARFDEFNRRSVFRSPSNFLISHTLFSSL